MHFSFPLQSATNPTKLLEDFVVNRLTKVIVATSWLLAAFGVQGNPVITNVSGDLVHNGEVSILGTGFGSKSPAKPYYWIAYGDGDIQGGPGFSRAQWTDTTYGSLSTNKPKAASSTHTLWADMGGGGGTQLGPDDITFPAGGVTEASQDSRFRRMTLFYRIRYNWEVPDNVDLSEYNLKNVRLASRQMRQWDPSTAGTNGQWNINTNMFYARFTNSSSSSALVFDQVKDKWITRTLRFEDNSNLNVSDGTIDWFEDGVVKTPNPGPNKKVRVSFDVDDNEDGPQAIDKVHFEEWAGSGRGQTAGYEAYIDELYIDDSWARVLITDSPVWNEMTPQKEAIQIPTQWSDTSISVKVRQGDLPNISSMYLYVFDANGNHNNNGYLIACDKCPKPPSQFKCEGAGCSQ